MISFPTKLTKTKLTFSKKKKTRGGDKVASSTDISQEKDYGSLEVVELLLSQD